MQEPIIWSVIIAVVVLLAKNFDKHYPLFILISPFVNEFVPLPRLSPVTASTILSMAGTVFYLYRYRFGSVSILRQGIFGAMAILAASLIVSNYYAAEKHQFGVFSIITTYINILIFCDLLRRNPAKIIASTYRYSLILGTIIGCYGLFEITFNDNPYMRMVSSAKLYSNGTVITEVRFGFKRTQTFFSMHETNAGISYLLIALLAYLRHGEKWQNTKGRYVVIALLTVNLFASGSRAAMIGLFIFAIALIKKSNLKTFFILSPFIVLLLDYFLYDYIVSITSSITDTSNISGSNVDMRTQQFNIASYYLMRSPWVGNGITYTWTYVTVYDREILGAESLWLPVMIDQGFLGVGSYVLFILYSLYYTIRKKAFVLCFFVVGFIIFNSLSSIPNVSFTYIFVVIAAVVAANNLNKAHTALSIGRIANRKRLTDHPEKC